MIKSLYYVLCIYGCSLLILCSSSDGGLMYQCAVRELLIINYFLVHKIEVESLISSTQVLL